MKVKSRLSFSMNLHPSTKVIVSVMGDSRKYPYHSTDCYSEFRGQGGFFELEFRRHRGILMSGILKAWGLDLGFTQGTDKNAFLESAFLRTF